MFLDTELEDFPDIQLSEPDVKRVPNKEKKKRKEAKKETGEEGDEGETSMFFLFCAILLNTLIVPYHVIT